MFARTNSTEEKPMETSSPEGKGAFPRFFSQRFLALLALVLFALVLTAPSDIGQGNERRMVAYISDAVENNHWMCQYDEMGGIASKPPMFCWLSGASTVLTGQINRLTLYWPTALATLALSCILFRVGKSQFGASAGFFAGWTYLFSSVALGQMTTCRYDGLFTFFVTLAAIAAYRAWIAGASWTWFWIASAGATLTKGPLGLILAAAGLLAAVWERKSAERKPIQGSHFFGIAIFFLITGGWFALAYWQVGGALIQKMIYQELFTHAIGKEAENSSGPGFYKPLVYFITGFFPWSLLTISGIWRAWKHPSSPSGPRRFERFLVCWLGFGLLVFSLGGHQRARLISPLIPAAALLAGIQLARLTKSFSTVKLAKMALIATLLILGGIGLSLHTLNTASKGVREARAMQELIAVVQKNVGEHFPFTHADPPFAFPYYLNELHQFASYPRAAELLRGPTPVFVAVEELPRLQKQFGSNEPVFFELIRWPTQGKPMIHIVSNHPRLEWTDKMAVATGPFRLELSAARLLKNRAHQLTFRALTNNASVKIFNETEKNQIVKVRWENSTAPILERSLKPDEGWEVKPAGN